MTELTEDVRNDLHKNLLAERQRLEHEIATLSETGIRAGTFQADESDAYDQHPADAASELFEREKNLSVQRTLEVSLTEVNRAIERYDEGTYGTCEQCGNPIPVGRLQAVPEAILCISCQSKREQEQAAGSHA